MQSTAAPKTQQSTTPTFQRPAQPSSPALARAAQQRRKPSCFSVSPCHPSCPSPVLSEPRSHPTLCSHTRTRTRTTTAQTTRPTPPTPNSVTSRHRLPAARNSPAQVSKPTFPYRPCHLARKRAHEGFLHGQRITLVESWSRTDPAVHLPPPQTSSLSQSLFCPPSPVSPVKAWLPCLPPASIRSFVRSKRGR